MRVFPVEASSLTHAQHRAGLLAGRSPLLKLQKDEKLILLVRSGNQSAFETLFDRYQPRLLAFCRHMLRSNEDAEDVLQEVFVAAYNAILQDDRRINARPWLYRIARNRCLNHLRRPVPEGQDTMDFLQSDGGTSTAERVQRREEFRRIVGDVQSLPETQRTALLLRELDALSYEDIAHAMDTTVPSVKSLLVRARIALAECSQARHMTCAEVQIELAEAAEGLTKLTAPGRRHVRECERCAEFRKELRHNERALAVALLPVAPLLLLKNAILGKLGIGAAGATGAAASGGGAGIVSGAAASGGGLSALGSVICSKTAAGMATAALLTAGAVEAKRHSHHAPATGQTGTAQPVGSAPVKPPPAPVPAVAPAGEREAQPRGQTNSATQDQEQAAETLRAERRATYRERMREAYEERNAERRSNVEREQESEPTQQGAEEPRVTDGLLPAGERPSDQPRATSGSTSGQESEAEQTGDEQTATSSSTQDRQAGSSSGPSGGTLAPAPE